MSELRPKVQSLLQELDHYPDTPHCIRCQKELDGLTVITSDIDQAYEACDPTAVAPAWAFWAQKYVEKFDQKVVQVRKGKKAKGILNKTNSSYRNSCYGITLAVVCKAIISFTSYNFVLLGDAVWEGQGIAIGGILSGVCVAILLGYQEYCWEIDDLCHAFEGFHLLARISASIGWIRYVDDVLTCSRVLCGPCCFAFIGRAYGCQLSAVSGVAAPDKIHIWTDVQLNVMGQNVMLNNKNPNREWLRRQEAGSARPKATILPWVGFLPTSFNALRANLISRMSRSKELGLGIQLGCIRLLEDLLELSRIGYPNKLVRALIHSLPVTAEAQAARRAIRIWHSNLNTTSAAMGYADKRSNEPNKPNTWQTSYQRGRNDNRQRNEKGHQDRSDKRRGSKGRKRSRRSSSSSSTNSADRLKRAQKLVFENDPEL